MTDTDPPHEVVAAAATKVLQAHFGLAGLLDGAPSDLPTLAEPYLAELEDALDDLRALLAHDRLAEPDR
jgi:hypothetical protein